MLKFKVKINYHFNHISDSCFIFYPSNINLELCLVLKNFDGKYEEN